MDSVDDSYRLLMADVYELAGVSRRISGREASEHGATSPQWQVLSVLEGQPDTVPGIATRLGITRQAIQRVINDLLDEGWVRRHPADRAARSPRFEMTGAGRRVLARLWNSSGARRETTVARAGIAPDELDAARATVRRLIEALRSAEDRDTSPPAA